MPHVWFVDASGHLAASIWNCKSQPLNSASPIDERLGCRRLVNCPRQAHDDLRGPYLDAKRLCRSRSFCTSWIPPATRAAFL